MNFEAGLSTPASRPRHLQVLYSVLHGSAALMAVTSSVHGKAVAPIAVSSLVYSNVAAYGGVRPPPRRRAALPLWWSQASSRAHVQGGSHGCSSHPQCQAAS